MLKKRKFKKLMRELEVITKKEQLEKDKVAHHELFIAKLNGIIVEMPHDELGSIPIEPKFVIEQLDYDVITAGEMLQEKLNAEKPKKKE